MATRHFTPKFFAFLNALADNNDREWFKAHQEDYLEHVREPALDFINDFAKPLKSISEHFVADSRPVGGSLFRIQRDTRFAKDKTPYKENVGIQFRHLLTKDVHAPGFYMNLQPGECYVGVGLWRPETKNAYAVRRHIDEHQPAWKKVTRGKRFAEVFTLGGESLVRPPKGYGDDHPYIDDLKRKDFIASTRVTQKQVTSNDFLEQFTDYCKRAAPFNRFLCEALGLEF